MGYGVYLHIPYCHSRCRYCDFYTIPASSAVPDEYIQALLRDFNKYVITMGGGSKIPPSTVYLGGGTPSLLTPRQVETLLNEISPEFDGEITLEANPESVTLEKLRDWRVAGVNRLSLGVQSARDESLKRLGRLHTAQQAAQALEWARQAGFQNITGDIMLSLPQYSREEFDDTLDLLAQGGATHISAYLLKIEANTPFGKNLPSGMPDDDQSAETYLYAVEQLAHKGYQQYEISNFAQEGQEGRHNLLYWNLDDWLGIGPAAHSSMVGRRFSFSPDLDQFLAGGTPPRYEGPVTANDYIMLRLRLNEGLHLESLRDRFGVTLDEQQMETLEKLRQNGYARLQEDRWALTPQGMLVQNAVLAQLLEEEGPARS